MILVGLLFGGRVNLSSLTGFLDLLYLSLLSAIAYSLWGILLKHNPVSNVTVFSCTIPVFGVILTMLLLPNEASKVSAMNLVITLILNSSGILLLNYKKSQKNKI